jgi:hypothetical protein
MEYIIDITFEDMNAGDVKDELAAALSDEVSQIPDTHVEVKLPKPPLGSFAALDPGTLQIILTLLGGTSVFAIVMQGLLKIVMEKVKNKNKPVKVRCGQNTLEIPGNISEENVRKIAEKFIKECGESGA